MAPRASGTRLLTYGEDGTLRIWQVFDEQGFPVCTGYNGAGEPQCYPLSRTLVSHGAAINTAHWLDDETILVTDSDSAAHRISLKTGQSETLEDRSGEYPEIRWDLAGRRIFAYVDELLLTEESNPNGQVLDFPSGALRVEIPGPIASAFWLEQGLLISRSSGAAILVDPDTGQPLVEFQGLSSKITAIQLYKDERLAIAVENKVIHILNPRTGEEISWLEDSRPTLFPIEELQWSQDGSRLLAANQRVTLWDVAAGAIIWSTEATDLPSHASFSPDDQFVAVTSDATFCVYDAETGKLLWRNGDHIGRIKGIQWVTGKQWEHQDRYGRLLGNLIRWVNGAPWDWDRSRSLLLTWSWDQSARLWDWEGRAEIHRVVSSGPINAAAVSDNGSFLLTADQYGALRISPIWLHTPNALFDEAQHPNYQTRTLPAEQ
jgi:WD40 repeat protein